MKFHLLLLPARAAGEFFMHENRGSHNIKSTNIVFLLSAFAALFDPCGSHKIT